MTLRASLSCDFMCKFCITSYQATQLAEIFRILHLFLI